MCRKLEEIHLKNPEDFLKNINSFPVDINQILDDWKIETAKVSFDDLQKELRFKKLKITGLAFARNDDLCILYSETSDLPAARFTLAHELGHCCLHMDVDSSCHIELQTSSDVLGNSQEKYVLFDQKKENEADKFARDLLIPTDALLLLLKKNESLSPELLADFFAVPIEQIYLKLNEVS